MGGYSASSQNVNFDYAGALSTAQKLYELSGVIRTKHDARAAEARQAVDTWEGGHRAAFDSKLSTEGSDVSAIAGALVDLANLFATKWAEARGEQDRINHARYVQHEKDDDSWGENAWEAVAGEDDYGPPPENPRAPSPPEYGVRYYHPVHSEYEHR